MHTKAVTNQRKINVRPSLLLVVLMLPFLSVIYLFHAELEEKSRFFEKQTAALDNIIEIRLLLKEVQDYRSTMGAYLNGAKEYETYLPEHGARVDKMIDIFEKHHKHMDVYHGFMSEEWRSLREHSYAMGYKTSFMAYATFVERHLLSLQNILGSFYLEPDTHLDSHYLAEIINLLLPQIEGLDQIRQLSVNMDASSDLLLNEKARLNAQAELINKNVDSMHYKMGLLFERFPMLGKSLLSAVMECNDKIKGFLFMAHEKIFETSVNEVLKEDYIIASGAAVDSYFGLFDAFSSEFNNMIAKRRLETRQKHYALIICVVLVLVAVGVIYVRLVKQQHERNILLEDLQQSVTALDESKQEIQAIIDNAAEGIVTINDKGIIESFSSVAERMFGYSANEAIGKMVNILMPESYADSHDEYIRRYKETGKGSIINVGPREVFARRSDGSIFPMELSVSEMCMTEHRCIFIGILRDITRRKESEKALRTSEERLALIIEGSKDGIWDWDLKTGRIYFSPRWKNMLGYTKDEIEDDFLSLQTLIHQDDLGMALDAWLSCMEGDINDFSIEYRVQCKNGEYLWIQCRGLALIDDEGNPIRIAGSHTDISESKRAYSELLEMAGNLQTKTGELEKINRELDQFAYVTSHDLKAPLRAIANLSQWIEEDLQDVMTDDARKQMILLRGRVLRMEALINGILQYSRVGRVDMGIETVDVSQLLDEILEGLAPPEKFNIEIGSNMPVIKTARVPLSQVFSNLINNAVKYHHRTDGHISVLVKELTDSYDDSDLKKSTTRNLEGKGRSKLNGAYYEFSVTDDGPGIAPEYHEKIFQIFQTLHARDEVESTGVGLTVVKKIIEELGGNIRIESAEGQGSAFRFTLPETYVA